MAPRFPIPTKAFDDLVKEEIEGLAAMLNDSGKSIAVIVVAASGDVSESYCATRTKPSERETILGGLSSRLDILKRGWRE